MQDLLETRQFLHHLSRRNEIVLARLAEEIRARTQDLIDLHEEHKAQRPLIDELREHGLGGRG